ncbi:DNA repair protein complementing XP-G cells isoform X2 [Denticeps clupeoides]|nr:DNA repair protein complementing XP-G cells isoform X2 [Denticeps clupeoides]
MYVLPALPTPEEKEKSSSDEEGQEWQETSGNHLHWQDDFYDDPSAVDINSEQFCQLPPEIKHEILKEMKEFSKRRRTMFHKPPERSGDFSQYQLAGLLQRNRLNQRLEGVEQEMSQRTSAALDLQQEQDGSVEARRLVSEDSAHYILIKGPKKNVPENVPETQPATMPWSSGPWARRGRLKGRPEPLWRPLLDETPDEDKPSPSSSSKPSVCEGSLSSDVAPPSPRTLQAIQAAMLGSSSDEEGGVIIREDPSESLAPAGDVSPRTQQAIQDALQGDDMVPLQELHSGNQFSSNDRVTLSSSDEDELITVSKNSAASSVPDFSRQDGGVSPRTLLAIQKTLDGGELDRSRSGGEEVEEAMGARSLAFRPALQRDAERQEDDGKESSTTNAPLPSKPQSSLSSDVESDEEPSAPVSVGKQEVSYATGNSAEKGLGQQRLLGNVQIETNERNGQNEESGSEESFIEVSEGEEERLEKASEEVTRPADNEAKEEDEQKKEETKEEEVQEDVRISETEEEGVQQQHQKEEEEERKCLRATDWDHIDLQELEQLENSLQLQQNSLREQQQQQERGAATVTGQMYLESQELLRLFGVPFVVAPMEAEAQCAALDRADQTHGTITDDSDIWLFGGRQVFKNFFNQNKYVEQYQYVDLQNQLGLDRSKLINLAYLLGSDYTEGVPGVGYVTGMEILNEFPGPGVEPLIQFSGWWEECQKSKKMAANPKDSKVKRKLRGLNLQPGFPNPAVAQAYLQPAVDQSEACFSWGRPHLGLIKEFCQSRFGWSCRKTEDTLQPVLKQLSSQQTQLRIDSFFRMEQHERQNIRSQRLRRAVTCLKRKERDGRQDGEVEEDEEGEGDPSPTKKGKTGWSEKEKTDSIGPVGAFAGGFLGSEVRSDELLIMEREESPLKKKTLATLKTHPQRAELPKSSSSSSDSDDQADGSVTMVTARSVFKGKTRGRGRRGGQVRSKRKQ